MNSTQGNGNYLDRPNGLLTRPDVAFLVGALNAACISANAMEEVFGPAMVYNRAALERLMAVGGGGGVNVNEWIDEQVGMLLKFGSPILQVSRIETLAKLMGHAEPPGDGFLMQIPDSDTDSETVDAVVKAAQAGCPVLLSGRADKIHPELLKLAGAQLATATTVHPAARVNATLMGHADSGWATQQVLSLSSRVGVQATAGAGAALASVSDGGAVLVAATQTPPFENRRAIWAQLNDLGGGEDVSLANFGTPGLYQAVAAMMNAASQTILVAKGINSTHPATVHAWRSGGTAKVLVGNLEGAYCGGKAIPGQNFGYTDGCSIGLEPQGGFAGGTPLTLELALSPKAMGVLGDAPQMDATCATWSLRCLDGMRPPLHMSHKGSGDFVFFEPLELGPREAHAYELQCSKQ
jgi:hypothetical protein